jgi:integrase
VKDVQYRIDAFILPELGKTKVARLTTQKIRGWHRKLAATPPRLRTRPGKEQQYQVLSDDPESVRKRRHSANRVLTILKAALNFAWQESRIADADNWRRVKPFKGVDAPRVRILTDGDVRRLSNACDREFQPLVQAALLTGCRYGEITNLRVSEINLAVGSVHVRVSKSGNPRDVALTDEGCQFFSRAIAGKQSGDIVFLRNDGRRWGKSHQTRPLAKACEAARIVPAISFHILRHAYATRLAMANTPMAVIAKQLGHADTRMAEKHYAHLAPSYVADTVRANFSSLGIVSDSQNIVPIESTDRG